MFNGDELTPEPHTRNPSRGIELCGVVEAMFSYNTMFSTFGDVAFADRAERVRAHGSEKVGMIASVLFFSLMELCWFACNR